MKNILLVIFSAISINSFGQAWTDYKVDSNLTLMIPGNYKAQDTSGQRVIKAEIDNGLILISILANSGELSMNVESEEELLKVYKGFEKGYVNSQHGQLIKDEIIENSGLKMIRFSFRAAMSGEKQIRHCTAVFVNDKMYSINFLEVESLTNEMAEQREKLFSSLKFSPNLGRKNQMSYKQENDKAYNQGLLLGKITIALIIGLGVWVSSRRKKKKVFAKPISKRDI
ncbi:hypothetical protein A3860_37855 [Niastella vici]|uniref:Uncharacterized protein n=1 Tax=Niastella vici TaxID=1703345 RepID=A0A1V9FM45_9BACT|nr:hypothetical protein [Niastella vici]OQP59425.1 hypothetical protein A3860_37855 [Niastella vici]